MSEGFNVYFSENSCFLKYTSGILQGYKMKNILGLFDFATPLCNSFSFVGAENQTPKLINFQALIRRMCGLGSV